MNKENIMRKFLFLILISLSVLISFDSKLNASNIIKYEWTQVGDKWRYQCGDVYKTSQWIKENHSGTILYLYVDENGYRVSGFKIIDGDFYYFDDNGYRFDSKIFFDGELILFEKDGKISNVPSKTDRERLIDKYNAGNRNFAYSDAYGNQIIRENPEKSEKYKLKLTNKSNSDSSEDFSQQINQINQTKILEKLQSNKDPDLYKIEEKKLLSEYSWDTTIDKMDTVNFGSYIQNDEIGNIKEPIEWVILDRQDGKALLLSKYILENKLYYNEYVDNSWENSDLRKWFNEDFYKNAFTDAERELILETPLQNVSNPKFNISGGHNTIDKIFCLSLPEIEKYFDDYKEKIKSYTYTIRRLATRNTKYAGGSENDGSERFWYDRNNCFWIRLPGNEAFKSCFVAPYGEIDLYGAFSKRTYYTTEFGARPALWVKYK